MEEIKSINEIQVETLAAVKKRFAIELEAADNEDLLYPDRDTGDSRINALLNMFVKEGLLK